MAHAGAVHLDETLSRGELLLLLHRMVILDNDGCIRGYDESGLLGFGDACSHYRRMGLVLGEGEDDYAELFIQGRIGLYITITDQLGC